MKRVLTILLVISIALNIYLFLSKGENKVQASESEVVVLADVGNKANDEEKELENRQLYLKEIELLKKQMSEITRANERYKKKIAQLKERLASKPEELQPDKTQSVVSSSSEPSKEEIEKMQEEKRSVMNTFDTEQINPDWAFKTQDELNTIINDSGLLTEVSLNSVECKSTVCRVSVTPFNEGVGHKVNAFFEFSNGLRETKYSKFTAISQNVVSDDTNETYFYIVRPDKEG